jgi:hypothetical protein
MCARITGRRKGNTSEWSVLNTIAGGELDQDLYFIIDDACFHLSGHVNSQNTRYWLADKPHNLHEKQLYDQKIGV